MQILHISDTHLGVRRYNLESRENDVYEVFGNLIDIAINEHVNAVIHTGDLFDTYHPYPNSIKVAIDNLKKLKDKGIPFISIPGDHDTPKRRGMIYPQRLLVDLELLKLLTDEKVGPNSDKIRPAHYDISNNGMTLRIYGIKHIPTISRDLLIDSLHNLKPEGDRKILMMHQGLRSLLPFEGAWQIEEGDLPDGINYYAMGHFHTRFKERVKSGILAIAGSPDIIREEEIEGYNRFKKGAFLVDLSKKEVEVYDINLDIRPQEIVTLHVEKIDVELDLLTKKYSAYKKKPILHIILEGSPVSKMSIFKKLSRLECCTEFYRVVKDNTTSGREEKIELPSEHTITDIITSYLKSKGYNDEEAKLILEIINNYDSDDVELLIKKFAGLDNLS